MSVEDLVKKKYPLLEKEIFQYICGIFQSPDDFESPEDIFEAVGEVLTESLEACGEDEVKEFCDVLYAKLCSGQNGEDPGGVSGEGVAKLLDAPVHLAMKLKDDDVSAFSSILMAQGTDTRKNVDQKKLDKADAKIKQKQEKKAMKEKETQPKELVLVAPTTNQAVTKQVARAEASGGVVGDIRIDNFDIAFGNNVLLSCAEMNLVFGRRYGLVGRNGVGKTTLLRSIACRELHLPSHVSVLHVEQEVVGDDTTAVESVLESDEERSRLLKREKELVEVDGREEESGPNSPGAGSGELSQIYQRLQEIESDKAPAKAAGILAGLGFSPEMQCRHTSEFSGGWRMRIALARALFAKPDLLLLDEPTNMLDLKAIMWLEDYLQSWPTTILTVSHDRTFLAVVCTDIIHMHNERLDGYRGDYETFVKTKTEKLKNQQKEYEAQLQYRQHLQDFIDRWRYNAKRASAAQMRIKVLEKLPVLKPVETDAEVKFRFQDVDKLSPPILQLNDISFGYLQGRENSIFTNMNISADMESRIALVGENGSGKTTLVKLLTGELSPNDGYRNVHRNLKIAYFTQHHVDQLVLDVSAFEFIQSKFPGKKDEEYRHELGSFGISGDLALRPIASLSGGQKSRLAFALLAYTRPNFLILDEPTNHLDVETVDALGRVLTKFKGGVVLVSHDQHLIKMCATEVWLCKNKTVHRLEGGLEQYKIALESEFRTNQSI